MNKLKAWREIIILAAIGAALLLYIIFRTAGNINYELPVLPLLESDSIDRITAEDSQINLDFIKQEENWIISPEGWAADKSSLKAISSAIAELKPADLISSAGSLSRYDLDDEHRLTVKAYSEGQLMREIFIGKVSSSGIYSYVMFPGDSNVYSVRGDLPSRFGGERKTMREKQILSVPRDGLLKMSLSTGGGLTSLFDDGSGVWRSEGDFEPDNDKIKSIIPTLSPLRCTDFLEGEPSSSAEWILEIQSTEGSIVLEIWPETEDGFPARSSTNGYPVLLPAYTVRNILEVFGIVFE